MKSLPTRTVWKDHKSMSIAAAHFFVTACQRAVNSEGRFAVALSGGNTPKKFFELLGSPEFSRNIPWKKVHFFWSDERFVPHTSPESNYHTARKQLLDRIDIPPANINPVPVTGDPEQSARQYEQSVKKFFLNKPASFDWVMLGTGNDGHTASLFPNTPVLIENRKLIKQVWVKDKQAWRISFTYPLINRAKQIVLLVSGGEKQRVVETVFTRRARKIFPVQYITPERSIWFLDDEAAGTA